jgi:hypothetical protein
VTATKGSPAPLLFLLLGLGVTIFFAARDSEEDRCFDSVILLEPGYSQACFLKDQKMLVEKTDKGVILRCVCSRHPKESP